MADHLTTTAVPERDRLGYWKELVRNTYVPLEVSGRADGQAFFGEISLEPLGCLNLSLLKSCGQHAARTRTAIARSHADYFFILGQVSGEGTVRQDERETRLGSGGWAIVDSTRPYDLIFEHCFEQIVVAAPRVAVPNLIRPSATLTGQDLSHASPLGTIFSRYLSLLHAQAGTLTVETRPLLADSILNLLAATVNETLNEAGSARMPESQQLVRIKSFILHHLRDPDLCVGAVARASRISNRYMHKLFEEQGVTMSEYVRRLRLENCCRDLLSVRSRNLSITQIAFGWGFNSPSHFSYLFRQYYNVSASEYRRQHLGDPIPPTHAGSERPLRSLSSKT